MRKVSSSMGPQLGTYLLSDLPHAAMLVLRHEGVRGVARTLGRLIRRAARKPRAAHAGAPAARPAVTADARVPASPIQVQLRDDRLNVVYVTEATGISGGHRQVFEQLNRLARRGHAAALYTLGPPPDWFSLRVPVRTFESYDALVRDLAEQDAVKVATWWATAEPVLHATQTRGTPVYLVQDLETSYYEHDRERQRAVLASYRPDFSYLTNSSWIRARLKELGLDAALISPGIDLDTYRRPNVKRRTNVILTVGRSHYLKNLTLSWLAWRRLPKPRPELWMFGAEPDLARKFGVRYLTSPTDEEVTRLLGTATVFLQTSRHEGFCLPILEAMATATPVVCTDAHGNRDFCLDGVNCLMPDARSDAVAEALRTVLQDEKSREELGRAGLQTARRFDWSRQIGQLETFMERVQARAPGTSA